MQATTGSASPARDGASEARSRASPDARLRIAPHLHLPPPFLFVLLPRTKVDFDDLAKPRHSRYFVTAMSALPKLASYLRIEERAGFRIPQSRDDSGVDLRPNVFLVLIFPDSSEFRWVYEPPRLGSKLKSRYGDSWRVEDVLQSGVNMYTVDCRPQNLGRAGTRDLAHDLFERARKAMSPQERRRRRYLP